MFLLLFYFVVANNLAFHDVFEFCADELLANWCCAVNVESFLEVVVFVLYDTRQESFKNFFMLHKIFVQPVKAHFFVASHRFM